MIDSWRTIPVFVSSTFKDMQAERDYLNSFLLHELNEEFAVYQIDFKIIDLRWGVDTYNMDENEREAQVLKVCLDAISNNRPFFIALLGDRYGWIPPAKRWNNTYNSLNHKEKSLLGNIESKSVTELEILFGALGNVREVLSRSLFFFRTPDSYEGIEESKRTQYLEEKLENKPKLAALKKKIMQICEENGHSQAVHEYKLTWKNSKFEGIEDWGKLVFENLCREVKEEIELTSSIQPSNWYEQEQYKLDRFVYYLTQRFVGREELLSESIAFLQNNHTAKIMTAFSGAGKSSFMCELYKRLSSIRDSRQIVLFHSAGISQFAQQIESMLQNWSRLICENLQVEYIEEKDNSDYDFFSNQVRKQFLELIDLAKNKGYKVILLVDALDRFRQDNMAKYMQWLPNNISLLCTTTPGYELNPLKTNSSLQVEKMPLFSEKDAQNMLVHICKLYGKDINPEIVKILLQKKATDGTFAYLSPLWLSLVGNILFGLNADDFEEIEIQGGDSDVDKIQKFFCNLAGSFSANTEELFLTLLARASKIFGQELTMQTMKYIALSQNGLREKDLSALLCSHWDLLRFTSLRRWFRYLIIESESKQWRLGHAKLSESLISWNEHENIALHSDIAKYLISLPKNDMVRKHETMYHLIKGDLKKEIVKYCIESGNDYLLEEHTVAAIIQFYRNDKSVLDYLANCINAAQNNEDAILFAGKLILGLDDRISRTNQTALIQMAFILFKTIDSIDYRNCDIESTRWIGEMAHRLSSNCEHVNDYENMLYFVQIQEYCHKICVEHFKNDEKNQIFKNSLAMAYYKLGNYYSQKGDKENAFIYFDKMTNL